MATTRNGMGGMGTGQLALAAGGTPAATTTEEWTIAHPIKTIDLS